MSCRGLIQSEIRAFGECCTVCQQNTIGLLCVILATGYAIEIPRRFDAIAGSRPARSMKVGG